MTAKTDDWLHIDVVPVAASSLAQRRLRHVEILHDPRGLLLLADGTAEDGPLFPEATVATGFYLLGQLPVLLARNQPVLAQAGYAALRDTVPRGSICPRPGTNVLVWRCQAGSRRCFITLFQACATDPACAVAAPDVEDAFYRLVTQLNTQPITVDLSDATGARRARVVSGDALLGIA